MYNLKKILIVGIIMLLVGTSFTSLVGSNNPEDQTRMVTNTEPLDVHIIIDGTMGENGWFTSCVIITMEATSPNISYIMYRLDDGDWQTYTEPIVICENGIHLLCWYCVDNEGNQSMEKCIDIKIDQTPPVMNVWAEKIGLNTWLLIAEVTDETSGVNKVEFYQGGELLGTVTEAPYVWEWEYINAGHIHIIAYDYAGNLVVCIIRSIPVADSTNAKATVDTLVSDNSNPSGCDCDGCELEIELISGPGITIIIRNVGDSDCTNVKWSITFDGGIILLSRVTSGTILCIPPGENVTVSSGLIFGLGRTIITISVESAEGSPVTKEQEAFIFLFFIIIM